MLYLRFVCLGPGLVTSFGVFVRRVAETVKQWQRRGRVLRVQPTVHDKLLCNAWCTVCVCHCPRYNHVRAFFSQSHSEYSHRCWESLLWGKPTITGTMDGGLAGDPNLLAMDDSAIAEFAHTIAAVFCHTDAPMDGIVVQLHPLSTAYLPKVIVLLVQYSPGLRCFALRAHCVGLFRVLSRHRMRCRGCCGHRL